MKHSTSPTLATKTGRLTLGEGGEQSAVRSQAESVRRGGAKMVHKSI